MLVLTRKEGERFTVGDVTITVTRIFGSSVRIGIEAPEDVKVIRENAKDKAVQDGSKALWGMVGQWHPARIPDPEAWGGCGRSV